MAISALMTEADKVVNPKILEEYEFQQVLYIYYPAQLGKFPIETFISSSSKVNAMQPSYSRKPDFWICNTDIAA